MATKATGTSAAAPLPNVEVPSNNIRFQIELEFTQCLASPSYLNFLATNRYFDNPAFMNYLQYLKYWKQPQYAKYIIYPHALAFLDMLDDERFRQVITMQQAIMKRALASFWAFLTPCLVCCPCCLPLAFFFVMIQMIQREDFMTLVHSQQFYHWQTFLNNRMEVPVKDEQASADSSTNAPPS